MNTTVPAVDQKWVTGFIWGIRGRVGQLVVGQNVVVERTLVALFARGHLLLQGVWPGQAAGRFGVVQVHRSRIRLDCRSRLTCCRPTYWDRKSSTSGPEIFARRVRSDLHQSAAGG